MATLRDIRVRIKGVSNTSKITQAMKMISAAKLRRAQDAIESARPYIKKLDYIISDLIAGIGDGYTNPFISNREVKNIAIIIVGSDRGLCGGFNSQLIKNLSQHVAPQIRKEFGNVNISLVTVGRRTTQYYSKTDEFDVIKKFPNVFSELKFETAKDIVASVQYKFANGEYDKVYLYYNKFVNIIKQSPELIPLLPIQPSAKAPDDNKKSFNTDYIYEPNQAEILNELLPKLVNIKTWSSLLESNASEQAARMMAMETATTNARDLITQLSLIYNSKRQAAITTEMLEIVGGAEALSKK